MCTYGVVYVPCIIVSGSLRAGGLTAAKQDRTRAEPVVLSEVLGAAWVMGMFV